jgi:rsbT co-antagonist protein RsbR
MAEREPFTSRLSEEDRDLLRTIGGQLSHLIQGEHVDVPDVERNDELGILANMVHRVSKELSRNRKRDEERRAELQRRLQELEAAHATQERLVATIRELSTPIVTIHRGVLLLPLIGTVDAERARQLMGKLLERIAATRSPVVIIDITGVPTMDAEVADLILRATRAASLLGARTILCGVSPAVATVAVDKGIDLSAMTARGELEAALAMAISLV